MKCPQKYHIETISPKAFEALEETQVFPSENSPTGYVVSFRYKAPERSRVSVIGDWMFSDQYHSSCCESGRYWPHQWRKEYFPHTLLGLKQTPKELKNQTAGEEIDVSKFEFDWDILKLGIYEMEKNPDTGVFACTIPLPSGTFQYRFILDMPEGNPMKMVTVPDPKALPRCAAGENALYSVVKIPYDGSRQAEDRGVELAADDVKQGSIQYLQYPTDPVYGVGEVQTCAVYLPADYDESRKEPYPVLYLSHGGGDSLSAWLNQGAMPEMISRLISQGKSAAMVVVLMDNEIFRWNNGEKTIPNLTDYLMPYIEEKFHVYREKKGRAFAGLSAGGFLAFEVYETVGNLFEAVGIWSGGRRFDADYKKEHMRKVKLHIGAGRYDDALFAFAVPLENELVQQGIPFTSYTPNGGHQWSVWRKLLEDFVTRVFC